MRSFRHGLELLGRNRLACRSAPHSRFQLMRHPAGRFGYRHTRIHVFRAHTPSVELRGLEPLTPTLPARSGIVWGVRG
jgi:hypothetical protein